MSNNMEEMEELTPAQKRAGNIIAGVFVIACGIFLLLCGLNVIPLKISSVAVGSLLLTVGLVLLFTGAIQKNSVSLWLSFAFLVPALVELLVKATSLGYCQTYPLYIAIPAIASFFTMFLTKEWFSHLKVILFFGIIAGIFSLQAAGFSWALVLPILVIFIGLLVIYFAVKASKDKKNEL